MNIIHYYQRFILNNEFSVLAGCYLSPHHFKERHNFCFKLDELVLNKRNIKKLLKILFISLSDSFS
jgi:hypothetical protein